MNELYHHGIKGQRWGVRRFQNEDGSLTPEGEKRYGVVNGEFTSKSGFQKYLKDQKKDRVETYHMNKKEIKSNYSALSKQEREEILRSRYNSDEEYQQAKKDYKKHQGGKATAIALGSIGAVALHVAAAGAITTGVKKANHDRDVRRTQAAIQNMERLIESSKAKQEGYKSVIKDIRLGNRENERGKEMYEILKGEYKYQHQGTNEKLGGYHKNDLLTNAALHLRDQQKAQAEAEAAIPELKSTLETLLKKENRLRGITNMKHSNWMIADDNYLCHHGIKGQKWGIRRFQNEDGSLTPEGMKRYGVDSNGNMSKRGAANYYRDIYNNSKSSGKRGQDLHDDVRSKFGSYEEYQAFVKNYKNHKLKKAAIGVGAGIAGAAATAAGIYGITRGVRAAQDNRLARNNADRYEHMSMDDIIAFNKHAKEGIKTFSTGQDRLEAAREARISEAVAKQRLKTGNKVWKQMVNGAGKDGTGKINNTDFMQIATLNQDRANRMATGTKLERAYKNAIENRANMAIKASIKESKREFIGNTKLAAMNQAKMNAGKEATANMVNSFSNSLVGKLTTGAGTMIGGAALGAAAIAGKKVVTTMVDEQAGNNMFGGNYSKETKDKSSALTQPVTAQQAWKDRNKKKKEDEEQ